MKYYQVRWFQWMKWIISCWIQRTLHSCSTMDKPNTTDHQGSTIQQQHWKKIIQWLLPHRVFFFFFYILTAVQENVRVRKVITHGGGGAIDKQSCAQLLFTQRIPPWQERWSWRRWRLWSHLPRQRWAVEKDIPFEFSYGVSSVCSLEACFR